MRQIFELISVSRCAACMCAVHPEAIMKLSLCEQCVWLVCVAGSQSVHPRGNECVVNVW